MIEKQHTMIGTRRRLRALAVMGWGLEEVSERSNLPVMALRAARDEVMVIGDDIDGRVAATYRELVRRVGPNAELAAWARRQKWDGPLAWDDLDDAAEVPERGKARRGEQVVDPFAVEHALQHRDGRLLNRAERLVAARQLGMPNSPNSVISTKLGLSTSVAKSLRAALVAADRAAAEATRPAALAG